MRSEIVLKLEYQKSVGPSNIVDLLASKTALSKSEIKRLMISGGVWLKKCGKGKLLRIRRAKTELIPGDYLELYYLPLPSSELEKPKQLLRNKNYSIWYKPSGWFSQGTKYGDSSSLIRLVEKELGETFLVHRLDRDVSGLILFAHNRKSAHLFSELFVNKNIEKRYQAIVEGTLQTDINVVKEINLSLDGKDALTKYAVLKKENNQTYVEIEIVTGRKHQIRRHFAAIKHPIVNDMEYGNGVGEKIQLVAYSISFIDPFTKQKVKVELPEEDCLWQR